jgi:hypothetical protein
MSAGAGHLLGGSKKGRSDTVSGPVMVNADLLDMGTAVEHLQPDEAEGRILLVHGDQEPAVFQGRAVGVGFWRWRVGYRVHADSSKQLVA